MKSALPYIGIVLLLAVISVAITLFFGKSANFDLKDGEDQAIVNFGGSEFPEIESGSREIQEGVPAPQPYKKNEQESDAGNKRPADLLKAILSVTEKHSLQNSFMFKWKTSQVRTGLGEALATGQQISFQGTNDDAAIAKDYLRQQGFSSDFANTKSSDGYNFEGFSKQMVVCVVASSIQTGNSFQEKDTVESEEEIKIYCGEIR